MALRSVCGSTLRRFSNPNTRSFHVNMVPGPTRDLEWFTEGFSAQPDNINAVMSSIYTGARHSSVTPFSLHCRSSMDRWAIKGLRIGTIQKQKTSRSVVIVSGMHANEPIPIGVSLYVASALSRSPIAGVEVTVFPVLKPKDLELQCRSEQIIQAMTLGGIPPLLASESSTRIIEEYERVEGPLRSYIMKRSTNFVDVVVDLSASCSTMRLKHDSLARSMRHAGMLLEKLPQSSRTSCLAEGERTLLDKFIGPPAIIVELRDRNKSLCEDQIIPCGEHVLSAIHKLLADTDSRAAR